MLLGSAASSELWKGFCIYGSDHGWNLRPDSLLVTMWNILKAKVQSEFRIYSDHGWIVVNLMPDNCLVMVWSSGQCKHVIGRPIACGDKHFISMEFLYSLLVHICIDKGARQYNHVIGIPIACGGEHSISVEFLYSPPVQIHSSIKTVSQQRKFHSMVLRHSKTLNHLVKYKVLQKVT
eukprot:Gb_12526 [translate_table: standard]